MSLRKKLIEKDFGSMNERQFEAVTTVNGPLLVLAGAGSGKTTVLVNRVANIVKYGNAYKSSAPEKHTDADRTAAEEYLEGKRGDLPQGVFSVDAAKPWQILAITFTNKAANELRERIEKKLGDSSEGLWAGTFHSVCGKILRRNAERIGHTSHFTIYDTDDQRRLMKEIMKQEGVDEKFLPHKTVLSAISSSKNELVSPAEFEQYAGNDSRQKLISSLYYKYQKRLKEADALDFDDMIIKTVELLENNADILEYYGNKFRYIMVDEYQDTNHAQYVLVSLLASVHGNLCVVGDDDQSIYRFRGATIENILNFEDEFKAAKVIRLEQNYRSSGNILDAANAVIKNNLGRKGKSLWTDKGEGELITVYAAPDERLEAKFVADEILKSVKKGTAFSNHAVLYRMNAQSASIENALARSGVSYKVIGGYRFFERKEIRDVLAYLNLINNNNDDVRLRRIINEPKRGIGDTTVSKATDIATGLSVSLFEVFSHADEYAPISRAASKLMEFCEMIKALSELGEELSLSELFEQVLNKTGYRAALEAENTLEAKDRLENVKELASTIKQYELDADEPSLAEFLEEIALVSDTDSLDESDDKVVLMTIHSAKGLEFEKVYLVGLEEGIFPGTQSIYGGISEIEEERRLAYVAITRAKRKLTITRANSRLLFGNTSRNLPSRFLREIPEDLCDDKSTSSYIDVNTYPSANNVSIKKPTSYGNYSTQKPIAVDKNAYRVGMRVEHSTFGAGVIRSVTAMAGDMLLEIYFDSVGTKKLMAGYAKLKIM